MSTAFLPLSTGAEADDTRIDGASLRRAREARGLSVAEAARLLTLSRAQVEQIEGGGESAFYGAAHKALAVRKYAASLGLDADAVLGMLPVADIASEEAAALDLPVQPPSREALANVDIRSSLRSLVLGMLFFSAVAIAFAIVRGGLDRVLPTQPTVPAAPAPAAEQSPLGTDSAGGRMALEAAAMQTVPSDDACTARAPDSVPQWSPPYVRKPGYRLYITGPAGSEICVSDSAGKVSRLVLKDRAMQAIDGRPPYLVQSASLDALQMFLQGMKVKIPARSAAVRLVPGHGPAADAQAGEMRPAS